MPLSSRFQVTLAAVLDVTDTAVTAADVFAPWGFEAWPAITDSNVEPFSRRDTLVAVGVLALKNVTQFVAIVLAVPVRLAGTPEDEPVDEPVEVAAGVVAAAEVVAAGAEDEAAGADVDELDELLHAAAVSARQATPAAATSDCHLERRIFIKKQASSL